MNEIRLIPLLEQLIEEGSGGQPPERDLWRERARSVLVDIYGDDAHREVKRFEAGVFPGIVKSPHTVSSGQFEAAVQAGVIRGTKVLMVRLEELKARAVSQPATNLSPTELEHLHPLIKAACGGLYRDGHFTQAIFEAFKAVEARVRQLSGLDDSGRSLMASAFSEKNPSLPLNRLQTQSDRDEQEGFKLIFMGAAQGIRNPKAHDMVSQEDPQRTIDYLSLASLLMRRVDDAQQR